MCPSEMQPAVSFVAEKDTTIHHLHNVTRKSHDLDARSSMWRKTRTPGGCRFQLLLLVATLICALCRSQNALDEVKPGDIIELGDGQYWEDPKTKVGVPIKLPKFAACL